MRPVLKIEANPTTDSLRSQVERAWQELGEIVGAATVGRFSFTTAERKIRHAFTGTPRWFASGGDAPAIVYQTRAPDQNFLYLAASADVTCDITVF